MESIQLSFETANFKQHVLKLQRPIPAQQSPQRLLLLHGAGVAGELTWTFVSHYLSEWDEIYIPDFAGMGRAEFLQNSAPRLTDYCQQLDELMQHLQLTSADFDCAGYSFGGMVLERWLREQPFHNRVFLLEPAMLFSNDCDDILSKASVYQTIADEIYSGTANEQSYVRFLDSVSPQREANAATEAMTIARLQHNAEGFAHSLQAVTWALIEDCQYYSQWRAPWQGMSFVGELSWPAMHLRHQRLAQESQNWRYESVSKADHSLVFTRPRSIAKAINNAKLKK